jgi:hypothetical protein
MYTYFDVGIGAESLKEFLKAVKTVKTALAETSEAGD